MKKGSLEVETVEGAQEKVDKVLTSPTFTGIPRSPTAPVGTNTTQIATTAFVQNAVAVSGDNTFAKDGKSYKYNFEVNESGGLSFVYEEL